MDMQLLSFSPIILVSANHWSVHMREERVTVIALQKSVGLKNLL